MENTNDALTQLRTLLQEALQLLSRDDVCADTLKDSHYEIGKALRPAIEELRARETPLPHWTDMRDCAGVG
ncbi:MAG: hypothetical protein JST84_11295 [Acidobacteria bacterium]|jgi:hypothetical protein|nr:hypothetical protein [Acidobacteriota bacterium]